MFVLREIGPTIMPGLSVADMDLVSFHALYQHVERVRGVAKREDAWTAIRAAQSNYKVMEEWAQERWPKTKDEPEQDKTGPLSFMAALNLDKLK